MKLMDIIEAGNGLPSDVKNTDEDRIVGVIKGCFR